MSALEAAKSKLKTICQSTAQSTVDDLDVKRWLNDVATARTSAALAALFLEFLEASDEADVFSEEMLEVRAAASAALDGVAGITADVVLRHAKLYMEKIIVEGQRLLRDSKVVVRRKWAGKGGSKGTSSFATSTEEQEKANRKEFSEALALGDEMRREKKGVDVEKQRKEAFREALHAENIVDARTRADEVVMYKVEKQLGRGTGYVVLNPGKLLGSRQLEDLRARNVVGLSKTTPCVLRRASGSGVPLQVVWETDALQPPPAGVNCFVSLLVALMGLPLRALGVAADPLVVLNPSLVTMGDVTRMIARARASGSALGGFSLPRDLSFDTLDELLLLRRGCYIFTGLLHRGAMFYRHACGFNAGASLFFVNPWWVAVSEADRQQPELFAARIENEFGLALPPMLCCRALVLDVTAPGVQRLPLACKDAVSEVAASRPAATRAKGRKRNRSNAKTHRGTRRATKTKYLKASTGRLAAGGASEKEDGGVFI